MIVAHHAGEQLLLAIALGAAGAGSVGLAVARARVTELLRRLRRH